MRFIFHTSNILGSTSANPRSRRLGFGLGLLLAAVILFPACQDESAPEPTTATPVVTPAREPKIVDAPPPTHIRVNTVSLQNALFDRGQGMGYVNLFDGVAYGGQEASLNASRIDFRHQYRGKDISNQRSLESLSTKRRWDRSGLFAEATPTESKISGTRLDAEAFDSIKNDADLIASFPFENLHTGPVNNNRRAYLFDAKDEPLARVFAFVDKEGRRGLFKVLRAETGPEEGAPEGVMSIQIKIEDRTG